MTVLHAIVLALVQGLTEFLPVSSSGHLVLVPRLLGWNEQPLAFDVALHVGTTGAVLLYFHRDFIRLIRCSVGDALTHGVQLSRWSAYGRLALLIILGCVPAVFVGGLFSGWIEQHARATPVVATLLIAFGLVMLAAERWSNETSGLEKLDRRRVLAIGMAQALALFPGVSRSGITIATGMFCGLSRATAARFSFLLAAPVIVAAGVKELPEIRHAADQGVGVDALLAGMAVAFISGFLAIHLLLKYVASRPLHIFVWYRIGFAVFAVVTLAAR